MGSDLRCWGLRRIQQHAARQSKRARLRCRGAGGLALAGLGAIDEAGAAEGLEERPVERLEAWAVQGVDGDGGDSSF